jgi:pimeloyl-ACP methyl ester carboxylesterase
MATFVAGLVICVTPVAYSSSEWVLVAERGVKAYPDLTETVWQKVPIALPNGPYDKIGLHRLVKTGIEPLGVLFICPGTWSSGEQLISNPPEDSYVKDEAHTQSIYWANRGFDVYSIDYRTHFVPIYLTPSQLSFMADWGWDQWMSDIKEAVDMAKEVSGAKRIHMAGESFGGIAAMNYASFHWKEDLKGLIMLDPGAMGLLGVVGAKNPDPTDLYNLPVAIAAMKANGPWASEVHSTGGSSGGIYLFQYADKYPSAPSPVPGFNNITEYLAYAIYVAWGPGGVSNIYGGYGKPSVMIHVCATFDRYWPTRLGLETAAYVDWENCPDVTYDFDEHYSEIDVPLLAFQSQYFGFLNYGSFKHGIANPDFTATVLLGYGHLDVFDGEYSANDVSAPTYEWMVNHRMLVGYGRVRIGSKWTRGETTVYINTTVIDFKVDGVRAPWNIVQHYTDNDLEFYDGQGEIGSITILIYDEYAAALGSKVFFLGQRV